MLLLNIGLKTSTKNFEDARYPQGVLISEQYVQSYLSELLGRDNVVWTRVKESETEQTLVVSLELPFNDVIKDLIKELADATQQDCIAAYDCNTGDGELLGTYNYQWGVFNPKYFLL